MKTPTNKLVTSLFGALVAVALSTLSAHAAVLSYEGFYSATQISGIGGFSDPSYATGLTGSWSRTRGSGENLISRTSDGNWNTAANNVNNTFRVKNTIGATTYFNQVENNSYNVNQYQASLASPVSLGSSPIYISYVTSAKNGDFVGQAGLANSSTGKEITFGQGWNQSGSHYSTSASVNQDPGLRGNATSITISSWQMVLCIGKITQSGTTVTVSMYAFNLSTISSPLPTDEGAATALWTQTLTGVTETSWDKLEFVTSSWSANNTYPSIGQVRVANTWAGAMGGTDPVNPPSVVGSASPSSVNLGDNVLITATVTPNGSPTITSVVVNASAVGGGNSVSLVSAGGNVYTNTVTVTSATAYGSPLALPVLVTDGNTNSGSTNIYVTVISPTLFTWGGGGGDWSSANWQPNSLTSPLVSGPTTGAGVTAVVTNGQVTVDVNGGVGGVGAIVVPTGGTLLVHNAKYGGYTNILLTGGTLDTADSGAYHAYGASVLSAVTAGGATSSTIGTSSGSWYNLGGQNATAPATFTVSNGATLNVSGVLKGAIAANDNNYLPTGLIKQGGGTLALSAANTFSGGIVVSAGSLQFDTTDALPANSPLTVSNGAMVVLNYYGTIAVSSLVLNGVVQPGGTYGATGSGADYINDTYFSGTGLVSASGAAPNTQLTWTAAVNNTWDDSTFNWTNNSSAVAWGEFPVGSDSALFGTNGVGSVNMSFSGTFYASNITFNAAGYELAGAATLGNTPNFVANSDATVSAVFSGSGGLTKSGNAVLSLFGANSYTGDTTISGGTLTLTNGGSIYNGGYNNSSVLTVQNNGTLELDKWGYGPGAANQSLGGLDYNPARFIINGGTVRCTGGAAAAPTAPAEAPYGPGFTIGANGATLDAALAGDTWTVKNDSRGYGPITSTAGGTLRLTGVGDGVFDKVLGGTGGVIKSGSGTWTLNLASTYTGNTVVSNGTLLVSGSIASTNITVAGGTLSLASTTTLTASTNTTLTLASGAVANLNYSGTITLKSLVLNGVSQASGTYGATGSGADHVNDPYFTGTGLVSVPSSAAPTLGYANLGGGQLQFTWTGSATLQVQTNTLGTGMGTNWMDYPGTSPVTVPVNPANGSVFFRLKQ